MSNQQDFERNGYAVIERIVSGCECAKLIELLPITESAGSRTLLSLTPYRNLARQLRWHDQLSCFLNGLVAIECILFRKSADHNWAVPLHRDAVLPIKGSGVWSPSGTKEGMVCAKPPRDFMDKCVAVRVHLDGAPTEDVSVIPGSHKDAEKHSRTRAHAVAVSRGGAMVMCPTLAHASSKLQAVQHRRVLHYVFAPTEIPDGYAWYGAA